MEAESSYPFFEPTEKQNVVEGAFASIKELSKDPNWVVKEFSQVLDDDFRDFLELSELDAKTPQPRMTQERFTGEIKREKDLFDTTATKLKEFIPENHLVYGTNNQGQERGFMVMRKVNGTEIQRMDAMTPDQLDKLEQLLSTALDFYEESRDKNGKGVKYFPDLMETPITENVPYKLNNVMFGRLEGGAQDGVYFIDTYPLRVTRSRETEVQLFKNFSQALSTFENEQKVQFSDELIGRVNKYTKNMV